MGMAMLMSMRCSWLARFELEEEEENEQGWEMAFLAELVQAKNASMMGEMIDEHSEQHWQEYVQHLLRLAYSLGIRSSTREVRISDEHH